MTLDKGHNEVKAIRMLSMFERLTRGDVLAKEAEALRFHVNCKTIQRDIDDLRAYFADQLGTDSNRVEYDRVKNGYSLKRNRSDWLTREEVLWLTRILLESRSLPTADIRLLLDKLINQCPHEERDCIKRILQNEEHHYVPLKHGRNLMKILWELSQASREQRIIELRYQRELQDHPSMRRVLPQGVLFSEYYFYLLAYIDGHAFDFPTIYRLDRVQRYTVTGERFRVEYAGRFQEGELRKRIQFMQSGRLLMVIFRFWGESLDAILDRLPTAEIVKQDQDGTILKAEIFGRGIKMWFLSQAQYLEVLEPKELREEIKETIARMYELYQ